MKFFCIDANTTLAGHDALFERLRLNAKSGSRHVFIVPDRFTLSVEREICQKCFENGSFDVDTCSFTRFATKALKNQVKKCLTKEGTVFLMRRVIERVSDKLVFYKGVKSVSFAREIFAAIASLRSGGITPEKIRGTLPSMEGSVADKLSDLALICEEYEKELQEKYIDTVSRVELLCERASQIPYVTESHIYILGFNVYSELQMRLIKKLLRVCPSVSVAFCTPDVGVKNAYLYPSSQRSILLDYCEGEGIPVCRERADGFLNEPFLTLHKNMFGLSQKIRSVSPQEKKKVRVFSAINPYAEVKSVAAEIRSLVFRDGFRYRDIAVASNDESYCHIVKEVFGRFAIPCFTDEKFDVSRGFFVRYIAALFAFISSDFSLQTAKELLFQPLFEATQQQRQTFENHCVAYNVNHLRQDRTFVGGEEDAETVRKKLFEIVERVPKDGKKVSDFCDFLQNVLDSAEMEEIRAECARREETDLKAYADTDKVQSVIDQLVELCGSEETTREAFGELFFAGVEGMSLSLLPQKSDCVFIGNTANSRFSDIKILFVIGAGDGFFPSQKGDAVVLGCMDTEIMRKNGLPVFPTPTESNVFEKFVLVDLTTKAERLYVSYAENGLEGEPLLPGEGVKEILSVLSAEKKPLDSYYDFTEEEKLLYRLGTVENCYYEYMAGGVPDEYAESVKEFLLAKGKTIRDPTFDQKCNPLVGYTKTEKGYSVSVSKLENYFRCPYRHFLSDVLKLRQKEKGEMQANEKGALIHAVLEDYFRNNAQSIALRSSDEKEIEYSVEKVFSRPEYERFFDDMTAAYEMERLKKECRSALTVLSENVRHSSFVPTLFEVRFKEDGDFVLNAAGHTFSFVGVVDRVDFADKDIVIVDYKTGETDESLCKVYDGEKIQLYAYLKHYIEKGYSPSGVFYLPLKRGYVSGGRNYAMKGQMVDSVETYAMMDDRVRDATEKYDSPTVAVGVNIGAGGDVQFARGKGSLVAKKAFYDITDYVMRLVGTALCDIADGDIEKNPMQDACENCPYVLMCGTVRERVRPKVTAKTFSRTEEENNG